MSGRRFLHARMNVRDELLGMDDKGVRLMSNLAKQTVPPIQEGLRWDDHTTHHHVNVDSSYLETLNSTIDAL
jgi:hypothetical protein